MSESINSIVKNRLVINSGNLDKLVFETYGFPFDTQRGERDQDSYIDFYREIDGSGADKQGYWAGLKMRNYHTDYSDAVYKDLNTDEEVVEYWRNHSDNKNSFRPFDDEHLNENGENVLWQPSEDWVLNDLVKRNIIPAGHYIITVSW